MKTHSSVLVWRISWTEEPGRLQSMGSQRVVHSRAWWMDTFFLSNWPEGTKLIYKVLHFLSLISIFILLLPIYFLMLIFWVEFSSHPILQIYFQCINCGVVTHSYCNQLSSWKYLASCCIPSAWQYHVLLIL